jgi:hypothetical protein
MTFDSQTLKNIRDRTDAKLRYAQIHLGLLRERGGNGGADFDRAVEEPILFHILGAKEAFLQELNIYYRCGLTPEAVSPGKLREAFASRVSTCRELAELHQLENDSDSWSLTRSKCETTLRT